MDYLKLHRTFFKKHKEERFSGNETVLYWTLVDLFNLEGVKSEWPDKLRFVDSTLSGHAGISPNTLEKNRQALKRRGLIEFDSAGKGFRGCYYQLIEAKSSSKIEELNGKRYSKFEELKPETSSNFE